MNWEKLKKNHYYTEPVEHIHTAQVFDTQEYDKLYENQKDLNHKVWNKFKNQYKTYTENVPKLLPRITPWKSGNKTTPKEIFRTIKTEKRTLQNIFFVSSVIIFKNKIIALFYFL